MNRRFVIVISFLLVLTSSAEAQTKFWVENQNKIVNRSLNPSIVLLASSKQKRLGAYCFLLVNRSYAEAYCGPTIALGPHAQVGVALGIEQNSPQPRFGSFVSCGNKRGYLLIILEEYGQTGHFQKVEGVLYVQRFGFGLIEQTGYGLAPRISVAIPAISTTLWCVVKPNAPTIISIRVSF
jgi:hypothetical protein